MLVVRSVLEMAVPMLVSHVARSPKGAAKELVDVKKLAK